VYGRRWQIGRVANPADVLDYPREALIAEQPQMRQRRQRRGFASQRKIHRPKIGHDWKVRDRCDHR
jgi:hypothetical protein